MPVGYGAGVGYTGENSSSIFADTRSNSSSGGNFAIGPNPNIAAVFGGVGAASWVKPAAITAGILLAVFILQRVARR